MNSAKIVVSFEVAVTGGTRTRNSAFDDAMAQLSDEQRAAVEDVQALKRNVGDFLVSSLVFGFGATIATIATFPIVGALFGLMGVGCVALAWGTNKLANERLERLC